MKKILLSLSMIAVVGVVVAGATGAFFSDTETSTGNTFTAGAIDLTVDSQQHYNGNVCALNSSQQYVWTGTDTYPVPGTVCDGTWTATDLGAQHQFFDFADVKPGDSGENTVSLHVSNDAWLRLVVKDVTDLDNSCTEPEEGSSDTCTVSTPEGTTAGAGELRENLMFSVFADANCNNVQDSGDVTLISSGTIDTNGEIWPLPTPIVGGPNATCFGIPWSLSSSVGNDTQTDSMSATMEFQVQQSRNNPTPTW